MTGSIKVSVDIEDFKKSHKGLIHLLKTINKAGGSISTRGLLLTINDWELMVIT